MPIELVEHAGDPGEQNVVWREKTSGYLGVFEKIGNLKNFWIWKKIFLKKISALFFEHPIDFDQYWLLAIRTREHAGHNR